MEWADDVTNRPRRANAGSRLQELLQNGLDEEDEKDLLGLDPSSSDTSFTLGSDEEALDEVDSDFDAEEVAGVLEGEVVETDATVHREERQERRQERQKRLQRAQKFSKAAAYDRAQQKKRRRQQKEGEKRARGGDDGSDHSDIEGSEKEVADLRQQVRHRPPPTIPCAVRLAEAQARAVERRAAQAAVAQEGGNDGNGEGAAVMHTHRGLNVGKTRAAASSASRTRRLSAVRRLEAGPGEVQSDDGSRSSAVHALSSSMPIFVSPRLALYGGVPQRIRYSSGVSVLERYKVPNIVSFSDAFPPALQG